ncbi:hypothetical protein HOLleu_10404 [Holothuria leucospilota]|uniref:Uncharacterized protein n=1 Tax=Holothuria leucospilota TaxID=206669 RepID=A0A9Q1CD28_HOLLE|nr:hypothetical protein HOLleu_10404 [Holothuria leucospilota]
MVCKYGILKDEIDGCVIGSGFDSLVSQIENRLYHLKRKPATKYDASIDSDDSVETSTPKTKKPKLKDSYGCVNWQPTHVVEGETENTLEEKRLWLLQEAEKISRDEKMITEYMAACYIIQRKLINQDPPVNILDVESKWPFLFEKPWLLQHFESLVGKSLEKTLLVEMQSRGKRVFDFLKCTSKQKSVRSCISSIEKGAKTVGNETPKTIGLVLLLLKHFEEESEKLIRFYKVSNL